MSDNIVRDRTHTIFHDFIPEHEYEVIVRAVGPDNTMEAMEHAVRNTIVIKGETASPDTPISLTATGFLKSITLTWTNPLNYTFDKMEIWRSETNKLATAVKIAEVSGISYIDPVGIANVIRYYWIRAVNTAREKSDHYPRISGVSATTLGVLATDIDDFAVTATKMFTKAIILTADSWTNNSPGAGSIAWNAHSIVYNGASYPITAGNTSQAYVYWTIGDATYSTSATHPALGTTAFMIAINTSGIHTLVWNSSANMVIGTAFIANLAVTDAKIALATITSAKIFDLDVDKLTANAASTNEFISNTAQIKNAIINDAKITGTITVGKTDAKCTDPLADQTSAHTAAAIAGQGALATLSIVEAAKLGTTVIVGGYIATSLLTATNIQAGTLTGQTVQTAASGQRIILDPDNTLKMYRGAEVAPCATLDDDATMGGPLLHLESITDGFGAVQIGDGSTQYTYLRHDYGHLQSAVSAVPLLTLRGMTGNLYVLAGANNAGTLTSAITPAGLIAAAVGFRVAGVAGISDATAGIISAATISGGIITAVTKVSHIGQGGAVHADVVAAGADGFMTGADKTKLNTIDSGADVTGANAPQAHTHVGSDIASGSIDINGSIDAGLGFKDNGSTGVDWSGNPDLLSSITISGGIITNYDIF